jgi:hypothetical protein
MKKEFLFLALLISSITLISFSSAASFQKSSTNDVIIPEFNQSAKIDLTISDIKPSIYHFYTFADISILPNGDFNLAEGSNNMEISIYPLDRIRSFRGFYTFVYNLKETFGSADFEDRMTIKVVPLKEAIEIASDTISPDTDAITFYIQNNERAKISNITAKFISIFFNKEVVFDLKPLEKTAITIPINKEESKKVKAGTYIVNAEFNTDDGKKVVEGKLYWAEKKGIATQESIDGFFIKRTTASKINIGNVPQVVEITSEKNIFSRLFTSFNIEPKAAKRDGLGVKYTWTKELGPAESIVVKVKTNYLMPWILIILVIIIIYAYVKYNERKVEVIKSVSHVKTKGGEFALKIRVLVKAKKAIENVSLIDRMPTMTQVYEKLWTVEPKKIDTINRRIYWDIGNMSLGEERIFSYVIYSKVGVLGKFTLPEAMVILEKGGKIYEITSNKVFFLSEQVRKAD